MTTLSQAYERRARTVKLARTWLRKAQSMLMYDKQRLPVDPLYWDLLAEALDTSYEILRALPDDFFVTTQSPSFFGLGGGSLNLSDTANEHVEKIVALLEERRSAAKRKRRIELLENVEGRTPEEAQTYKAAAERLRGAG